MTTSLEHLLQYMEKRFDEMGHRFGAVEQRLEELKEGFGVLQTSVDAYAKRADAYFQEMVAPSHKVERHDRWLHQIAERLGIKLEYS